MSHAKYKDSEQDWRNGPICSDKGLQLDSDWLLVAPTTDRSDLRITFVSFSSRVHPQLAGKCANTTRLETFPCPPLCSSLARCDDSLQIIVCEGAWETFAISVPLLSRSSKKGRKWVERSDWNLPLRPDWYKKLGAYGFPPSSLTTLLTLYTANLLNCLTEHKSHHVERISL